MLPKRMTETDIKNALVWDYEVDAVEFVRLLRGEIEKVVPFDRERALLRAFERLGWYDLVYLLGIDEIKKILRPDFIKKFRSRDLRARYEFISKILHGEPVSFSGRDSEGSAWLRSAAVSNRRHGS